MADIGRAVVTFEAPHGTDALTLHDGDVVQFGRDGACGVRFGYAPTPDRGVARIAGQFVVAGGRVIVESRGTAGNRALELRADGGPPVQLAHGEAFSPRAESFAIVVHGDRAWRIHVSVRPPSAVPGSASDDPATNRVILELTPAQRNVLRAYSAPLTRGLLEPATHKEVAEALGLHPNTVREALYGIYSRMFTAGVPMPDVSDKRVSVVEAARVHGLIEFVAP